MSEFDPVSEQCAVYQHSGLLYLPVSGRMGGEILSHRYLGTDGPQYVIVVWNLNLKVLFYNSSKRSQYHDNKTKLTLYNDVHERTYMTILFQT